MNRIAAFRRFLGLVMALAGMLTSYSASAELAKDFRLAGVADTTVSLNEYRGKIVYLDFWASWCGPCRVSFPWMDEMLAKYEAEGFQIVAVNLDDSIEDAEEFLLDNPVDFLVAFDPEGITPEAYDVKGMPTSFLIDRNGEIVKQHAGFNASYKDELESALLKLLETQP